MTSVRPGVGASLGAGLDWVWTFAFDPIGADRTQIPIRNRGKVQPRWLDLAGIVPADHIMTRSMFRGLQQRLTAQSVQ